MTVRVTPVAIPVSTAVLSLIKNHGNQPATRSLQYVKVSVKGVDGGGLKKIGNHETYRVVQFLSMFMKENDKKVESPLGYAP